MGWAAPTLLEYIPGDAMTAVARLAAQGGGTGISEPEQVFVHNLQGRTAEQLLTPFLILLAALLWPLDIAWRRLTLTRADVVRFFVVLREQVRQVRRLRRPSRVTAVETPPTLAATLRQRQQKTAGVEPSVSVVSPPEPTPVSSPPARAEMDAKPVLEHPPRDDAADADTLAARLKRRMRE